MTPGLLLWALVGVVGGGVVDRLADRLLEETGGVRAALLPRCPRCGRLQTPLHRIALLRRPCPGCGQRPAREQAAVELATGAPD